MTSRSGCMLNGEEVQKGRTRDMIFPVPELIARLSAIVTLLPGDLIFTGPSRRGRAGPQAAALPVTRHAPVSYVDEIGEITTQFTASPLPEVLSEESGPVQRYLKEE